MKYRTAAMFTLHQINAYEEDGFLVMDMCCGDNGEIIGDFTLENLRRKSGEEMDKVFCYSENILGFPESQTCELVQPDNSSCVTIYTFTRHFLHTHTLKIWWSI